MWYIIMDDTEIVKQALAGVIDTEAVAKQLEQAFKDVTFILPPHMLFNIYIVIILILTRKY